MAIPPLSVNSKVDVDAKDSCNSVCCIPKKDKKQRRHSETEVKIDATEGIERVDIVFQKHVEEQKQAKPKEKK